MDCPTPRGPELRCSRRPPAALPRLRGPLFELTADTTLQLLHYVVMKAVKRSSVIWFVVTLALIAAVVAFGAWYLQPFSDLEATDSGVTPAVDYR